MWQGSASAAGFATQQFGGEHGSVVESNPTALYYNPGALGFSEGTEVGLYGSLAVHGASWTHKPGPDEPPDPTTTGTGRLLNVFGGATIAASTHLTKNLVVGGGFFAPFFGLSHWAKNDAYSDSTQFPAAVDGPQRWFGIDGKIEVLYFSVGAAYRLGPLSIGATGNFISSTVSAFQARNAASTGVPDPKSEARAYFDVQGYSGSFAAGATAELVPGQLWLSGSYQAQPGMGPQAIDGDLFITLPKMQPQHYNVTFHQTLPDIVRAGVKLRPKKLPWEFRVFGDYTRWSVMQTQCVVEKGGSCQVGNMGEQLTGGTVLGFIRRFWSDTWGVRAGASYWVNPAAELFLGLGYEVGAVPDSTLAPDLPDANNLLGAIGGRFALTDYLFLLASYTHIQYLDRDNTGKSTLKSINGTASSPGWSYPTVEGNGGGQYSQFAGVFSGNLEAIF
jgi:long-chain fatty acid transport protein